MQETGETGLIEAVEWIMAHQKDNDVKSEPAQSPQKESSIVEFVENEELSKPSSEPPQAMSFKCDVLAFLKIFC